MAGIRLGTEDLVFKLGNSDCKVYIGDTLLYQPYSPSGQTPCFEVVEALSGASGDYVDVYNTSDAKWYKKNNLNQYEEYGIMPTVDALSGVTYYVGKLVILSTDSHEYKWTGSAWSDLGGMVSRLPEGYTEVEYVSNPNANAMIMTDSTPLDTLGNSFIVKAKIKPEYDSSLGDFQTIVNLEDYNIPYYGFTLRFRSPSGNFQFDQSEGGNGVYSATTNADGTMDVQVSCDSINSYITTGVKLGLFCSYQGRYNKYYRFCKGNIYSLEVTKNGVKDSEMIPCKNNNNIAGMYDLVRSTFYSSSTSYQLTAGNEVPGNVPEEYDTKVAPPDNVSYNTLAELELMECPWVGMHATVGGVPYIYTANGWEVVS